MYGIRDAQKEFDRARNQAIWQQALGFLQRKNYNLIDYDEVRKRLAKTVNALPVQKDIPIDAIVGSVSRNNDFTRTFLPKMDYDKNRWVNVRLANESMEGVPPIDVYQIGEVYFVLDGHHRISVMKSYGAQYINANVRIINTEVPLKPTDSPDEIIVKTEKQAFLDQTNIEKLIPEANLEMYLPGEYPELAEHIAVHRYFMGLDYKREISKDEAVMDWYHTVYMPVIEVIRSQKIMDEFPGKTETELYLWIENNKAALTEEYGEGLRMTALAWKLDEEYGKQKKSIGYRFKKAFFMIFSPDLSDWGIKTGDWRKELRKDDSSLSIQRMMISVRDPIEDFDYLRSAVYFCKQFNAWAGIVHVVKRPSMLDSEWIRKYEQDIQTLLEKENVKGKFFVLKGNLLKNLSDRAFWSDISLFKMNYRPSPSRYRSLGSGWNSIFMRVPGPIFVTPDLFPSKIQQILLAFSQSPKSREAMYFASGLAQSTGGHITVVVSGGDEQRRAITRQEVENYYQAQGIPAEYITSSDEPGKAIIENANRKRTDLIIMGGYSRSYIKRLFTGSTIEKVLSVTSIPVIICK